MSFNKYPLLSGEEKLREENWKLPEPLENVYLFTNFAIHKVTETHTQKSLSRHPKLASVVSYGQTLFLRRDSAKDLDKKEFETIKKHVLP